jgi:DNA (cytosine-5)-methyltransferase 1
LKEKRPKAFCLENVKNLKSHDNGKTFKIILDTLKELGYEVYYKIIDGQHWVPQHRERLIIIGERDNNSFSFNYNDFIFNGINYPPKGGKKLKAVLHRTDGGEPFLDHDKDRYFDFSKNKVWDKYTLTDSFWEWMQRYKEKSREKGRPFQYGLVTENDIARTLLACYHRTKGSEILIYQGRDKNPRRLTPRECARLMGFPDSFIIPVSDSKAYRQFGNSVVVPMFCEIAKAMKPLIKKEG